MKVLLVSCAAIVTSLLFVLALRRYSLTANWTPDLIASRVQEEDRACPSYFLWIHEDLAPWNKSGISRESMEEAKRKGHFRITIVGEKLYYERYQECIQTRDEFTMQGLLELIERFPGMVPDVELVFVCNDFPEVPKDGYQDKEPPPVFSYCKTRLGYHYDILFPDWTFWGWPEVRIRPWEEEKQKILNGSSSRNWEAREPIAYWKGNLWVMTKVREDLLQCNNTKYNVVVYYLDWAKEAEEGYPSSDLSKQCQVRYKVYVEGRGWSASLKYIMSCGSTVLHIEPDYWEFFARSWVPYVHYWPIDRQNLCSSIKYAVDYGNSHPSLAAKIGKRGQATMEELTMGHVYSYMVHVLQAYAKLQRFKPVAPEGVQPWVPKLAELSKAGKTRSDERHDLCVMPLRDERHVEEVAARQEAGYRNQTGLVGME